MIITDANGCVFVDSTNVNITDQRVVTLNPSAVLTFPSCFGLSDGGGGVTVTESNFSGADYTFTWLPAPVCTPFETNLSSLYACLSAGSYFVTAMDPVDGCMDTVTLTIGQPSELVLSPNGLQNPGCSQANSGSINVIAQGGSGGPNYTYTWDIPATGPNQSGLSVGDYSVTVTDVNGCQDSLDFTLTPPAPPALSIVLTPVKCGDDGALTANAPTAVLYNWEEVPSNGTIGDTIDITNLAGGTYAVTITDAVGCTAVDTVTLQDVTRMSFADTSFVQPLCFGDDDGILGVTVQDGQQPYVQYNWNPTNLNSPTILGLPRSFTT
ncbi:MAG: hypothetical protein IPH31_22390 [Lewinellaceae bacterium]|nr:hypothetical protein [Lewinellaceae bacterium]